MCGIIGILPLKPLNIPLGVLLYRCLKNLEYRGYDSVGIAVIHRGSLIVRKSQGKIDDVASKIGFEEVDGVIGIGHTRWATHGKPSDINAHPHTDCSGRIAVVHNGIIENYLELKEMLKTRGHRFVSETDTEVIPHLVEDFKKRGYDTYTAFKKAIAMLKGAFAIAMIDLDTPDRIYFARNTSPLVIGFHESMLFISSDIPAFLEYTNRVLVLYDGELGYVSRHGVVVEKLLEHEKFVSVDWRSRIRVVPWSFEEAKRGGYPHYMLKEIHEQPTALSQTLAGLSDDIDRVVELVTKADRIVLVGAGSSYHAAFIGSLALTNMAAIDSRAVISSEARWYFRSLSDRDVVIAVSQSGETIDTLLAVREAKRFGAKVVALSNVLDSAIPRESDFAIYTRAGPEIGVAATKTFTTQVLVLLYLAFKAGVKKGTLSKDRYSHILQELKKVPSYVDVVIKQYEDCMRRLSAFLVKKNSMYYLGRGPGLGVAMEGALKMKEIAYIHAEAYAAGESKHGPIALIEEGFPVIFTSLGVEDLELLTSNIEEMKARNAWILLVASKNDLVKKVSRLVDVVVAIPSTDFYISAIPAIVPLQLLAYYTAVARGFDPDKPRNLAKTVTVV